MVREGEEGEEGANLVGLEDGVVGWLAAGYEPGFFDGVGFGGGGGEVGCCCFCWGGGFMSGLVVIWFEEGKAADDAAFERHGLLLD